MQLNRKSNRTTQIIGKMAILCIIFVVTMSGMNYANAQQCLSINKKTSTSALRSQKTELQNSVARDFLPHIAAPAPPTINFS